MSSIVGRTITWGPVAPPVLCCICADPGRADGAAIVPATANQQRTNHRFVFRGLVFHAGRERDLDDIVHTDFAYVTCAIDAALAELNHRHVRLDHLRKDGVSVPVAESHTAGTRSSLSAHRHAVEATRSSGDPQY